MRGFAALLVLLYHAHAVGIADLRGDFPWLYVALYPIVIGFVGVHLFLVLSGFCIHLRLANQEEQTMRLPFRAFWVRRFWRLYPAYLAAIVFSVGLMFALEMWLANDWSMAHLMQMSKTTLPDLVTHLFMLHLFFPAFAMGLGNGVFWSLALEEHLYLLYSPVLWIRNKLGLTGLLAISAAVALVWRTVTIGFFDAKPTMPIGMEQGAYFLLLQAPSRWFEWCLGAAAVEAYVGRVKLPGWCYRLSTMLGFVGVAIAASYVPLGWVLREPAWGLAFFVMINIVVTKEKRQRLAETFKPGRWMALLAGVGVYSYSLYLIHGPLIHTCKYIGYNLGLGPIGQFMLRVAMSIMCLPLAWVFYRLFEKPFLNMGRRGSRVSTSEKGALTTGRGGNPAKLAA